jgi:hypothetical protein
MSSKKPCLANEEPSRMSRRDAMTLTAAVAAFGSVLGFVAGGAAEAGAIQASFKVERLVIKLYSKNSLLASYALPASVAQAMQEGRRVVFKLFRNERLEANPPFDWRE